MNLTNARYKVNRFVKLSAVSEALINLAIRLKLHLVCFA